MKEELPVDQELPVDIQTVEDVQPIEEAQPSDERLEKPASKQVQTNASFIVGMSQTKDDGIDWGRLKADYINNRTLTLKDIAEKYGVNENTVRGYSAKDRWIAERNKAANELSQAAVRETQRRLARAAAGFNARCLDASQKLIDLVHEKIDDARESGEVIEPNELGHLARAAKSAQEAGRLALGLSTDNKDVNVTATGESLEEKSLDQIDAELLSLMGEEAFKAWKSKGGK